MIRSWVLSRRASDHPGSRSNETRSDEATFVIVSAQVRGTADFPSRFDHAENTMAALPAGIVTFLFTDIEGSTRLWERDRAAMTRAARRHDAILDAAIANHNGVLFKHVGDAVQAAFSTPIDAVSAAVEAQRALAAEPWPETGPIRARMAIHCGEATPDSRGDYHQVAESQPSRPTHGVRTRRAGASVRHDSASGQQSAS